MSSDAINFFCMAARQFVYVTEHIVTGSVTGISAFVAPTSPMPRTPRYCCPKNHPRWPTNQLICCGRAMLYLLHTLLHSQNFPTVLRGMGLVMYTLSETSCPKVFVGRNHKYVKPFFFRLAWKALPMTSSASAFPLMITGMWHDSKNSWIMGTAWIIGLGCFGAGWLL